MTPTPRRLRPLDSYATAGTIDQPPAPRTTGPEHQHGPGAVAHLDRNPPTLPTTTDRREYLSASGGPRTIAVLPLRAATERLGDVTDQLPCRSHRPVTSPVARSARVVLAAMAAGAGTVLVLIGLAYVLCVLGPVDELPLGWPR